MFVSGLLFLVTLSRWLNFLTVQYVLRRTAPELANAITQVVSVYKRAGFNPRLASMDVDFEKLKKKLVEKIQLNTAAKNKHVAEIERKTRHTKERYRMIKADMPYEILPNPVIKALVIHAVLWMNACRAHSGISEEFSPREIILGWQLSTDLHCQE